MRNGGEVISTARLLGTAIAQATVISSRERDSQRSALGRWVTRSRPYFHPYNSV
jgi:hypothetical protein